MNSATQLSAYFRLLEQCSTLRWQGRVTEAVGQLVESNGPVCCVGECCDIVDADGRVYSGEIVGFRGQTVLSMPLEKPQGIRFGDRIIARGVRPALRVGKSLLGRVIDGAGRPLDGLGSYAADELWPLDGSAPLPLE